MMVLDNQQPHSIKNFNFKKAIECNLLLSECYPTCLWVILTPNTSEVISKCV